MKQLITYTRGNVRVNYQIM